LDCERLDLLVPDAHVLESAELADTVIEMHDEVARLELRERFECDGAAKATAATEPALAAEDLVIGEHAQRRFRALEHEAALHRAESELRSLRQAALSEELLETLEL